MSALVLALFFLLTPSQARGPAPHDLLGAVSDYYGKLDSLEADFEQKQKDANQTTGARGHLYLKKGRRARFDYVSPIERSDYFDGKTRTTYTPGQKQATSESMGKTEDERLMIFLILGNRESPWKDEFAEIRRGGDPMFAGNTLLTLIPHNTKNIRDLVVEVNPTTLLIHRFGFTRTVDKSYTEYIFTNIKTAPLPDSLFMFKAPPDVRVFVK